MKINKDATLAEIIKIKGAEKVLSKHDLPCLHCPMARFEMQNLKIGAIAKQYGIDIKNLLKELNKLGES